MRKKICFVTAARSEYGLLKWLIKDVNECPEFEMKLIVTGGHLSYEQGHTIDQIVGDGFQVSHIVDAKLENDTPSQIAESMGRMCEGFAKVFNEISPDYVVVLGDRYELLPICNTAFIMKIPIIHISGGDITEGALDDGIRNAITMLADYHFPGTEDSAQNIIRMRGTNDHIWPVGELGLDSFCREQLLSREKLARDLCLDMKKSWVLMTYHAETKKSLECNLNSVKTCIDALLSLDNCQTVITFANADFGGKQINEYVQKMAKQNPIKLKVVPSLGQLRYLSFMRQVSFIIGNSSSGIVEAPFLNIPVINVGDRQKGRYQCGNIYQCLPIQADILNKIELIKQSKNVISDDLHYWGDGHASERIITIMKQEII